MLHTKATILKNAFSLLGAQLTTWAAAIVVTLVVPRYLGPTQSGQMIIGSSIWVGVSLAAEFGMDTATVKAVVRTPEHIPQLFGTIMLLRVIFFALGCILVGGYTYFMGYSSYFTLVIFVIGLAQFLIILSGTCKSILEGLESMQYIAVADTATKLSSMALAITAVLLKSDILVFALISVVASSVYLAILLFFARRRFLPKLDIHHTFVREVLKSGLPYLFSNVGLVIYNVIDIWLIAHLAGAEAVGWYGAAGRLIGTSLFIPSIAMTVLFPVLSRIDATDMDQKVRIMRRGFEMLFLMAVPVGLGVFVIGSPIINLLYGPRFTPSGPILSVMGIFVIFTYLNTLFGRYMFAIDRQRTWVIVILGATLVKVPLELLLIPWFQVSQGNGALGAAFGTVATEALMVVIGIRLMPNGIFVIGHIITDVKIVVSGLAMAFMAWLFRDLFVTIPIIAGAVVYASLVLILRIIPEEDLQLAGTFWQRVLRRFQRTTPTT